MLRTVALHRIWTYTTPVQSWCNCLGGDRTHCWSQQTDNHFYGPQPIATSWKCHTLTTTCCHKCRWLTLCEFFCDNWSCLQERRPGHAGQNGNGHHRMEQHGRLVFRACQDERQSPGRGETQTEESGSVNQHLQSIWDGSWEDSPTCEVSWCAQWSTNDQADSQETSDALSWWSQSR